MAPFAVATVLVVRALKSSLILLSLLAGLAALVLFPGIGVTLLPSLNALRQVAKVAENLTPAVPVAILSCGAILLHRSLAGRALLHRSPLNLSAAMFVAFCCVMAPIQLGGVREALIQLRVLLSMGVMYFLFSEWADDGRKVRLLALATLAGGSFPMLAAVQHLVTLGVLGSAIRARALVENANVGAFFLTTSVPFAIAFALDGRSRLARRAWWTLVALFAVATLATLSRTGLGLFVLVGALTVALATGKARSVWRLLGLLGVSAGLAALLVSRLPGAMEDALTLLARRPSERLVLAKVGWRMFKDQPLTGVGPDQYRFHFVQYLSPDEFVQAKEYYETYTDIPIEQIDVPAHNAYILCFTEEGLVGGLLFLGTVVGSVAIAYRALKRFRASSDPWGVRLGSATVASLAAMALSLMTIDLYNEKLVWQLIGTAAAVARFSEHAPPPSPVA